MIVQHNIMALNAYNRLSANNSSVSKNLEKLSSGYKINRAGDDAAGLAISEKMRAQITGLERASDNAQDGISLVQTAEGALTEVHSMLNRMVELATQSANGTYDNTTDRANLQKEVESLQSEIDRIADETNFNGINLLDGSLGAAATQTEVAGTDSVIDTANGGSAAVAAVYTIDFTGFAATSGQTVIHNGVTVTEGTTTGFAEANDAATNTAAVAAAWSADAAFADYDIAVSGTTVTLTAKTAGADANATAMETTMTGDATITDKSVTTTATGADEVLGTNGIAATGSTTTLDFTGKTGAAVAGSSVTIGGTTYEFVKAGGTAADGNTAVAVAEDADASAIASALEGVVGASVTVDGEAYTVAAGTDADAGKLTFTSTSTGSGVEALEISQTGTGLNLQIGDTASQRISVKVASMDSKTLGVDVSKVDISSEDGAKNALSIIKTAINTVSGTRADLGAIQNRLEYTVNNLATTTENLTSAEARIRDTDMAKEMMAYTKNNVLSQAAQAMLAQANQQPQQVLQLLQ